jgi:hypothetical protein
MSKATPIFVFQCGTNYFGLTTQADGGNLPPLSQCEAPWLPLKAVPQREAEQLAPYVRDVGEALSNLTARGYHLTHIAADGLPYRRD